MWRVYWGFFLFGSFKIVYRVQNIFSGSFLSVLLIGLVLSVLGSLPAAAMAQVSDQRVDFQREVLPILSQRCFACHGFDEQAREAGLRLDLRDGGIARLDSGEHAIVPGKAAASELIKRVSADDADLRMPPEDGGKRLTREEIATLANWINQGAEYRKHWAFERPSDVELPVVAGVDHPIDRFIRRRLAEVNIKPSEPTDAAKLVRRISLDLTGLPPTLEQIDHFESSVSRNRSAAVDELVEQLLSSSHYGERWGRWWLDQARYADSNGYSIDAPRKIWKFRDWVIDAMNSDMPFDQFTVEQLAGDLLPNASVSQKVATGFHRNTQINQEGGIDKEQFRVESVVDRVATTGTVWLGLTVGCAQCHDHKFDPISQEEYYRLFAFFNNQDEPTLKVKLNAAVDPDAIRRLKLAEREVDGYIESRSAAYQAWESKLTAAEIGKMKAPLRKLLAIKPTKRTAAQKRQLFNIEVGKVDSKFQSLRTKLEKLEGEVNGTTTTLVMSERKRPRKTTVLIKGDFTRPAKEVSPGTPALLHTFQSEAAANRLDLARWIVRADNPLTARVIVNRVWQVYFGRGLVETENDFGTLGSAPTHPELLDWLSLEFQRGGWSLKKLHRLIVTSQTYQQSSKQRDDLKQVDPQNYLLARQTRLRLEAEIVRDVCLSVSDLLSPKMGGPPVYPPIPAGVMNRGQVNRKWNASKGDDRYRRGIYTFVFRATPPPSLNVFDAPDGFSTCTRRSRSNTPLQALTLLNDSAFMEFARALETRIADIGVEKAFRIATGRRPRADELGVLSKLSPLATARVLLNLDETITRP